MISRPIQSVLDQTFQDWELIVVDDGSTDNTDDIVLAYNDSRIRYYHKKHEELSEARNYGIKKAKGSYLCFLDSDDYFLENHLQVHFDYLNDYDFPEIVLYSGTFVEKNKKLNKYPHLIESDDIIHSLWQVGYNLLPFTFHRCFFEGKKFDGSLNYVEDLDFLLSIYDEQKWFFVEPYTNVVVNHDSRSIVTRFKKEIIKNGKQHISAMDSILNRHTNLLRNHLTNQQIKTKKNRFIKTYIRASIKKLNITGLIYFSFQYFFSKIFR